MSNTNRREFIKETATLTAGAAVGIGALKRSTASWAGANERIRVGIIGINGRGRKYHANRFPSLPKGASGAPQFPEETHENVEVAVLCDVDTRTYEPCAKGLFDDRGLKRPAFEQDFRKVLDDDSIDVVSIATTNHWHTPIAVMACQAGKDVYVEKPISHNVWEGRQLVEAAKKYNRVVQHGTQIRSSPGSQEAIQKLKEGVIGDVYMAKGLCYKTRNSIGHTPEKPAPPEVDYDMWLGPAPKRPFSENRFHYNWHWHWDYGNGDIGNQGVHQMDVARWGLGVGLPPQINAQGGHFSYDDDQETPNTLVATFTYPDAGKRGLLLVFEVRHMHTYPELGVTIGNIFFGSEGYMILDSYTGYKTFLKNGEEGPSRYEDKSHVDNFIEAVRARKPEMVNAPPEEGHISASMCHLANISYRLGRSVEFDPDTERCKRDDEANAMLKPNYREPYTIPKIV
ncbi:MAG: Gfo/Idh/MocA family oxidoreductase [Candidatus Omnitrophica bacterium]|nr:Gfo/Idh/MocA family oxidoreductase [Candidatus Omnitrophota bacterium]